MKESEGERGLTKEEACGILQVAPTADAELITQAYWHLARRYRGDMARDPQARHRLDELNRAYLVLNPSQREAPLAKETPPAPAPPPWATDFFAWLRQVIEEVAGRWPERTAEVAVLAATTGLLTFLALSAGASALWTLLAAGVAALAIWAPWRRS